MASSVTYEVVIRALTTLADDYDPNDLGGPRCVRCWKEFRIEAGVCLDEIIIFEHESGDYGVSFHRRCFDEMPAYMREALQGEP